MTDAPADAPTKPGDPSESAPIAGENVDPTPAEQSSAGGDPEHKSYRNLIEWALVLGGALLIAALIRMFLFQAFYIPSPSMNPTLVKDDRVVVNKLSYDAHAVHRGDIVVFSRPPGVPPKDKDLIKRVIGLPGETVSLKDGKVYIDGKQLDEPYTAKGSTSYPLLFPNCSVNLTTPLKVPKGTVFVMGDNRNESLDGRCFGPIPESTIVGRAFLLIWPINHLSWL